MMNKTISRMLAMVMLVIAIIFFAFAITHPMLSFPWSNKITYTIYAVYTLIMIILFITLWRKKK